MGLNAEMVRIAAELRRDSLRGSEAGALSVLELGAQDLCAAPSVVDHILDEFGWSKAAEPTTTARAMYQRIGFDDYRCIDATGGPGVLLFDLNKDIRSEYAFSEQFDLVTNLGTAEHCFNQWQVFKNVHELCRPGAYMVHAAPCAGNVNHGFFNYHPRFFADLATANGYDMLRMEFTVDYTPHLHRYAPATFKRYDARDLLLYVVMRRVGGSPFKTPFDGMFAADNVFSSYAKQGDDPLCTMFAPYLKGGSWEGTKGLAALPWWKRGRIGRALGLIAPK